MFRLSGRIHEVREVGCIVIQIMTVFAVVLLRYRVSFIVEILFSQFSVAVLEQEVGTTHRALGDCRYRVGLFFYVQFTRPALRETKSEIQSLAA